MTTEQEPRLKNKECKCDCRCKRGIRYGIRCGRCASGIHSQGGK